MIYVGVFVRLLIFTSWGGESIWWAGESWSFGAFMEERTSVMSWY
jgi:hypothetical protein